VNHFYGLKSFVESWDEEPSARPLTLGHSSISKDGHINLEGGADCTEAQIFPKWHPQFERALEEGVKELVEELIERLDCITYTSCQGHLLTDSNAAQNIALQLRQVGILPRNPIEHLYLYGVLARAAKLANDRAQTQKVRIVLTNDILTSEDFDSDCLNITFTDSGNRAGDYFERVEVVYREFIKELQAL
jgi:hypothetical protein